MTSNPKHKRVQGRLPVACSMKDYDFHGDSKTFYESAENTLKMLFESVSFPFDDLYNRTFITISTFF